MTINKKSHSDASDKAQGFSEATLSETTPSVTERERNEI